MRSDAIPTRRAALAEMFSAVVLFGGAASAATGDGAPALGAGATGLRLVANLSGAPVVTVLRGDVWGFLPQADDLAVERFARRLYGYHGLAVRQATPQADGGVALKTKAWSFYLDAESGAVVTEIRNPYTCAMVPTRPLSGPTSTLMLRPREDSTKGAAVTVRRLGPHAFVDVARVSRFTSPDITWFKLEADFNTFACLAADLDDPRRSHVPSVFSHNLVAEWQTWMKMHGAPGHILFRGSGSAVPSLAAAPEALRQAVQSHFPDGLLEVSDWWDRPKPKRERVP